MATAGGAIVGYCAIGSCIIARPPAIIMMIASTQAKTGRWIKNLDIGIRTLLRDGRRGILFGLHGDAGTYFLQTADDNFFTGFQTAGD